MENLENSGKFEKLSKSQGNLNFCRKNLENSGNLVSQKCGHPEVGTCFVHCVIEIAMFGAEYFKWNHSYDLEASISELVLKRAFRK